MAIAGDRPHRRAAARLIAGAAVAGLAACMTGKATPMGDGADTRTVTVSTGDPMSAARPLLGPPTVERPLRNDAPATMGAAVVEYVFRDDVAVLVRGAERRHVRAVQLVLDPAGRVLRILENPNPYHGAAPRLQRGTPFLAEQVVMPVDPALRVPPQ